MSIRCRSLSCRLITISRRKLLAYIENIVETLYSNIIFFKYYNMYRNIFLTLILNIRVRNGKYFRHK